MNGLVFALLSFNHDKASDYEFKLREFTLAWTKYRYQGEVIEGDSIDSIMSQVAQTNASYCLIQSVGHIIDERWYLPHWNRQGFYESIDNLMQRGDFLVAAEWDANSSAQGEVRIELKMDCLLVNIQHYRELGSPVFDAVNDDSVSLGCVVQDQAISKSGDNLVTVELGKGGHWLKKSLHAGLKVHSLGESANHCRFNLSEGEGSPRDSI